MKFRPHRGSLDRAMAEMVEVDGIDGLKAHLRAIDYLQDGGVVKVEPYGGIDKRIGWDTHIVLIDDIPVGFTDGPA